MKGLVLALVLCLAAAPAWAGSLTITTKDDRGRVQTLVDEEYETDVKTKSGAPAPKPEVSSVQAPAGSPLRDMINMVRQEKEFLLTEIERHRRVLRTTLNEQALRVYKLRLKRLQKKYALLESDPSEYFRQKQREEAAAAPTGASQ